MGSPLKRAPQAALLEVVWHALEHAGTDTAALRGMRVGTYMGVPRWMGGEASSCVAYTLGLQGPSLSISTGASSSLAAAHVATQVE